jgi:predicted ATPase
MPQYRVSKIKIKGLYGRSDFDIDFENQPRISFLLGPNGIGKTTILHIIESFLDSGLVPQLYKYKSKESSQGKILFLEPVYRKLSITLSRNDENLLVNAEQSAHFTSDALTYTFSLDKNGAVSRSFLLECGNGVCEFPFQIWQGKVLVPSKEFNHYVKFAGFSSKSHIFCINDEANRLNRVKSGPVVGENILCINASLSKAIDILQSFSTERGIPSFPFEFFMYSLYKAAFFGGGDYDSWHVFFAHIANSYHEAKNNHCILQSLQSFFDVLFNSYLPRFLRVLEKMKADGIPVRQAELFDGFQFLRKSGPLPGICFSHPDAFASIQNSLANLQIDQNFTLFSTVFNPSGNIGSFLIELFSISESLFAVIGTFNSEFQATHSAQMSFDVNESKELRFSVVGIGGLTHIRFSDLSSGEQNVITMLFNACFKRDFDSAFSYVYLLDEPEVSLHIAWQHELVDSLISVLNVHNTQVIIATHSPFIIGNHIDMVAKTVCKNAE